jgi:hypothetical protein
MECIVFKSSLLDAPVRLVVDNCEFTFEGNVYAPCGIDIQLPENLSEQVPQCTLSLDGINQQLTRMIEQSNGLQGYVCEVFATYGTGKEMSIEMDVQGCSITRKTVNVNLAMKSILGQRFVFLTFTRMTHPQLMG